MYCSLASCDYLGAHTGADTSTRADLAVAALCELARSPRKGNRTSHPPFHPLSFALCVRLHLPSRGRAAMLAAQLTRVPRAPAGRLDPGMRLDAPAPTVTAAFAESCARFREIADQKQIQTDCRTVR